MEKNKYLIVIVLSFILWGCNQKNQKTEKTTQKELKEQKTPEETKIFPEGTKGSPETFIGEVYHYPLVSPDSTYTTLAGNVDFEAGARSNWHSHPAGQILIITRGEGYHQIEGKPREIIKKGDVVKCPPNVNHWHGASADKSMSHIYIIPNTEKGIVEWKQAVTDAEYLNK